MAGFWCDVFLVAGVWCEGIHTGEPLSGVLHNPVDHAGEGVRLVNEVRERVGLRVRVTVCVCTVSR